VNELCIVCEHFVTNRVIFDQACKWCCIQKLTVRGPAKRLEEHRNPGTFLLILVVYEDILFPVRKARSKPVQGCTTNAKVVFESREKNFMVYCIKSCRKIQKPENRNAVLIKGSEKVVEYTGKNSLCDVPGPVSRLMNAEQIVC